MSSTIPPSPPPSSSSAPVTTAKVDSGINPSPSKRIKLATEIETESVPSTLIPTAPLNSIMTEGTSSAATAINGDIPIDIASGSGAGTGIASTSTSTFPGLGESSTNGNGHTTSNSKIEQDEESDDEPEEEEEPLVEEDLSRRDMYLDTISRQQLDFDFERLCSKSLSNQNIYACLVCGKYFQGRGKESWAYRHAVGEGHKVWVNLETEKFYVLPENYLVSDPSLNDILTVLNPKYEPSQIPSLTYLPSKPSYTLSGDKYLPGYIGLNNIKSNDYMNVISHLLLHVPPIRSFLLDPTTPQLLPNANPPPTELVKRLSALAKKIWNPRLFKSQASPHEFLQEVNKRSEGKFKITEQGDPVGFLGWLLNTLHRDLGGGKKPNSSVIYRTFQGEVRIQTQEVLVNKQTARPIFDISRDIKTIKSPFLFLALDLPPQPLFLDLNERRIVPQVPLSQILAKFDGNSTQEMGNTLKRHHLTRLPPYLILHIKRFTKNNFVEERNPTIVNFPLQVDLKEYVDPKPSDPISTMYDLVVNIPHESTIATTSSSGTGPGVSKRKVQEEGDTAWKVHLRAGRGGDDHEKWLALQDLQVEEIRRELVFLSDVVLQVWERRK